MNNFTLRVISGTLFVVSVAGSIIIGKWTFGALFLIITIMGMLELLKLLEKNNNQPQKIEGLILGAGMFILTFLTSSGLISYKNFFLLIPLFVLIFITELYRKNKNPFINISLTFFSALYIALPLSLIITFVFNSNDGQYDYRILLSYFILIWIYDSAAYVFGVSFGKHRLFERHSPKKSWEGFIGGSAVTLIAGWGLTLIFTDLNIVDWLIIPILIIIGGTYGDLAESMFKRSINQKDSGNLIPGHGGILDRFDAIFLSSPLVFTYLQLI